MSSRVPRNHPSVPEDLFKGWKGDWSEWHTVITTKDGTDYEKRSSDKGNLLGYKATNENLKTWFGRYDDGIYEWRKIGPRGGNPTVVYVGKTSSAGSGSLMRRIQCYTRYQSHERLNINRALQDGFQLQARVLSCGKTGSTAENMEKRALKAFAYEWNDMNQKS